MRIHAILAAWAVICLPLTPTIICQAAPAAPARAQMPLPSCSGAYSITRVSEITPTGSVDKFMAAVAAHQAWYTSHGLPDIVFASRVAVRDQKSGAWSYSDKQMLTYHFQKADGPPPAHDAAWDAYVKLYGETSSIKETFVTCIPTEDLPATLK